MDEIILELPARQHELEANRFKAEFLSRSEDSIHGGARLTHLDYLTWVELNERNRTSLVVVEGWVPSTTFFGVRPRDGRVVGIIDVRHFLGNEYLRSYGGHIGYSVRPSERGNGYAAVMLGRALEYARTLGLTKVMLACHATNVASAETIVTCGGVLAEVKEHPDGTLRNVYWISLR